MPPSSIFRWKRAKACVSDFAAVSQSGTGPAWKSSGIWSLNAASAAAGARAGAGGYLLDQGLMKQTCMLSLRAGSSSCHEAAQSEQLVSEVCLRGSSAQLFACGAKQRQRQHGAGPASGHN